MSSKTIADLGPQEQPKPVVGRSMISDERQALEQRIRELEERRAAENATLEAGGYDYDGGEAWIEAMERIGRR